MNDKAIFRLIIAISITALVWAGFLTITATTGVMTIWQAGVANKLAAIPSLKINDPNFMVVFVLDKTPVPLKIIYHNFAINNDI